MSASETELQSTSSAGTGRPDPSVSSLEPGGLSSTDSSWESVGPYLQLLEKDIVAAPSRLKSLQADPELVNLLEGVDLTGWLPTEQPPQR